MNINTALFKKYLIISAVSIFALAWLATALVAVFHERSYANVQEAMIIYTKHEDDFYWQIEGYKQVLDILLGKFVY